MSNLSAAPLVPDEDGVETTAAGPTIDNVAQISRNDFRKQYFRPKQPVLITGVARQWPALRKWSFSFFRDLAEDRTVVLEHGNVLQGQTAFETSGFRSYIEQLMVSGGQNDTGKARRYLALFNIFDHFPALRADVDFSLLTDLTLWHYPFGWLGPKGTLTGYHIDWVDNLLAQIQGRKKIWLVPPRDSHCMYPSSKYDYRSTLSGVDPDNYDPNRHPWFAQVRPFQLVLEPGHMLYIPRGWWHRVQSLDASISVNMFAHDLKGILFHQSRAKLKDSLHRSGLLGNGNCTCHMDVSRRRIGKESA